MGKTLVIFGAGASFDCASGEEFVADESLHPPLTPGLFNPKLLKERYKFDCPSLEACIPDIYLRTNRTDEKAENVELILREIQEKANDGKELRKQQLKDLKKYFSRYFSDVSQNYLKSGSLYHELCTAFYDGDEEVDFVSFNYDTLLESAMEVVYGKKFDLISQYISSKPILVKPHGSWNWFYDSMGEEHSGPRRRDRTGRHIAGKAYHDNIFDLENPALGLPVKDHKNFVCPDEHIRALQMNILDVDKVLIIGWRGDEPHFVEVIKCLPANCKVTVVTGTGSGRAVLEKLPWLTDPDPTITSGGFKSYFRNR